MRAPFEVCSLCSIQMPDPHRAQLLTIRAATGRSELARRAVTPALRPFLRELNGYREHYCGPLQRNELPRPDVVAIFELGPPLRVGRGEPPRRRTGSGGFVVGLADRPLATEHDGVQEGIELVLSPQGAARLFGVAPAELAGHVVEIADLLPPAQRGLPEELCELSGWDARFDRVEHFLLERLARAGPAPLHPILEGVQRLQGRVQARELARSAGVSPKRLIALSRDESGVAPKRLCRIVRFDALVRALRAGSSLSWAELASGLGYSDQAHLANEVGRMAGLTPTDLLATLRELPLPPDPAAGRNFSPRQTAARL